MSIHSPHRLRESQGLVNQEGVEVRQETGEEVIHWDPVAVVIHRVWVTGEVHLARAREAGPIQQVPCACPQGSASFLPQQHGVRDEQRGRRVVKIRPSRLHLQQ